MISEEKTRDPVGVRAFSRRLPPRTRVRLFSAEGGICMCRGIGLDLCEIARMEKLLSDDRFLSRFFTPGEAEYVRSRGAGAAASLAGLFAAREALGKALGCGIGFDLREAEVRHDESGAPFFHLSGALKERLEGTELFLSISHDGGIAAAVCLLESKNPSPNP